MLQLSNLKIAIIGLGYVGLPLAVEFVKKLLVGIRAGNIYQNYIHKFQAGQDHTLKVWSEELQQATQLTYSANLEDLRSCNFFIGTIPTPIDEFNAATNKKYVLYDLKYILNQSDVDI